MAKKAKRATQPAPREPLEIIGEQTGQAEFMRRIQPEVERQQREHESYYARLRDDIYASDFFEDVISGAVDALAAVSEEPQQRTLLITILEGEEFRQPLMRDVAVVYTAIAADLQKADEQGIIEKEDRRIRDEGKETIYTLINEYIKQAVATVIGEQSGPTISPLASIVRDDGYVEMPTQHAVWALIEAIEHGRTGEGWGDADGERSPTHTTVTNKRDSQPGAVYVSLRDRDGRLAPDDSTLPKLWEQVHVLSPLTSDVLIACLAACTQADGPAWINVDQFLDVRGVKRIQKRGEPGNWQHGHRTEDRIAVGRALGQLEAFWLEMQHVAVTPGGKRRQPQRLSVESRALVMLDRVMQHDLDGGAVIRAARVTLGGWAEAYKDLGIKQLGLLAQKALEYDPHNNQAEKALAKYLTFHYKYNAGDASIRRPVKDLLAIASIAADSSRPKRAQQRLEKALNRLQEDGVVANWRPVIDINTLPARGWFDFWINSMIDIEAPPIVRGRYAPLRALRSAKPNTAAG